MGAISIKNKMKLTFFGLLYFCVAFTEEYKSSFPFYTNLVKKLTESKKERQKEMDMLHDKLENHEEYHVKPTTDMHKMAAYEPLKQMFQSAQVDYQ